MGKRSGDTIIQGKEGRKKRTRLEGKEKGKKEGWKEGRKEGRMEEDRKEG